MQKAPSVLRRWSFLLKHAIVSVLAQVANGLAMRSSVTQGAIAYRFCCVQLIDVNLFCGAIVIFYIIHAPCVSM